jgi:hypothetical protein
MTRLDRDDEFLRRTVRLLDAGVQRIASDDAVRLRHAREQESVAGGPTSGNA